MMDCGVESAVHFQRNFEIWDMYQYDALVIHGNL